MARQMNSPWTTPQQSRKSAENRRRRMTIIMQVWENQSPVVNDEILLPDTKIVADGTQTDVYSS